MRIKNKYTSLQKYSFKYFTQLGYTFFHKQEIVLIPKNIKSFPIEERRQILILYNETHTFTKEEICLILEKYFCCNYILLLGAQLTKYLHLNFIFLKSKDTNYYKIKINYLIASPQIQKLVHASIFDPENYLRKKDRILSNSWRLQCVLGPAIEKRLASYTSLVTKYTTWKKIKLHKFLRLIKQTKFQRTHQFFNFLKHKKKALWFCSELAKYNYPDSTKSVITYQGFVGYNEEPCEDTIENFDYPEPTFFNIYVQCTRTLNILTINLFEIFKINNDFDLFYFLFYNYMIYNNMYINEKEQLVQIIQTDINKTKFTLALKQSLKMQKITKEYDSILLSAIPIEEVILGDINWFFDNLHTVLDIMCNLLPFYLDKNSILDKFSTILYKHKMENLKYYLKIRKLPTKEVILTKREYSETQAVYNWTSCLVVYLLKLNNLHTQLPTTYEQQHFFEIDLENLLKYTNIYAENLEYKLPDSIKERLNRLHTREFSIF